MSMRPSVSTEAAVGSAEGNGRSVVRDASSSLFREFRSGVRSGRDEPGLIANACVDIDIGIVVLEGTSCCSESKAV